MKFRYYIAETMNGEVTGTNDREIAKELAQYEECFVIDAETGEHLVDMRAIDIKEVEVSEAEGDTP